ncbi:DUF488 domain-containing protein [Rossellomorea sp. NS-SX7]|uniref:DUF488 domain-containing protein n=1 Tax=Rossellomorea sp. NS-SX7 TaxID=3463856 RepID=UPI00405938B2
MPVNIKRAYEEKSEQDGLRILVDRLWPRGRSKEELAVDHWIKQVAPSPGLRKWFNHEPDKFGEFKEKYKDELHNDEDKQSALKELKEIVEKEHKEVSLIYGAKDKSHNHAIVLKEILDRQQV